jgi:hypothetical protein
MRHPLFHAPCGAWLGNMEEYSFEHIPSGTLINFIHHCSSEHLFKLLRAVFIGQMLVILLLVVTINFKIMRIAENQASGYHGPKDYSQVPFEEG